MNSMAAAARVVVRRPTLIVPEVDVAEYPQEVRQRLHGILEQIAAGLVGEAPGTWASIVIEDTAVESRYLPVIDQIFVAG